MIDHIGFGVSDLARSKAFYVAALEPLGITLVVAFDTPDGGSHAGFGRDGKPFFWIGDGKRGTTAVHVAFAARTRAEVDAFHAAALADGGRDNGAPGPRPHYHPFYYGAFVLDPDDNNVEAVCHRSE